MVKNKVVDTSVSPWTKENPVDENVGVQPNYEFKETKGIGAVSHSVRFSVLGVAGITVNYTHLENLQELEGYEKESSYFSSPSKMKSVVTITSNNKVVGITDLSKPLSPADGPSQKETGEHRHLAFWANEQELTLGSRMNLHSSGAEAFHMTIGITDGILPAMPIGTACLVLDAQQMIEDGRIAAVLDIPISTAADKKMISVDSHVATNTVKKKKKKWFTRSTKEPSKPQQIDFHSVYATDKTGDAILRVQINLKPEEDEPVETSVEDKATTEVKHTIVDLDESLADSDEEMSIEDDIIEENVPVDADKGISIEEYTMFQILAQKRSFLDFTESSIEEKNTQDDKQKSLEEKKEVESTSNPFHGRNIANVFRGAMDMAISNFFTSQPSYYASTEVTSEGYPQEEGIEVVDALPSLTRVGESSFSVYDDDGVLRLNVDPLVVLQKEGGEIGLVSASSLRSQKTDSISLEGTENSKGDSKSLHSKGDSKSSKPLTAREQMVQNVEKKNPSQARAKPAPISNKEVRRAAPVPAAQQEESYDDLVRNANKPQHLRTLDDPVPKRSQGLPPSGRAGNKSLPPRPVGRPPRPTTNASPSRPPLPPTQIRTRGRETRNPHIPTTVIANPISKSWTLLDDDTYTLTVEGSFQVAPQQIQNHESKEGDPFVHQAGKQLITETRVTQAGPSSPLDQLFRCGKYEDARSLTNKDIVKLQEQVAMKDRTKNLKKLDDDKVSRRVPAVIIQYDHESVANDELTVDTRDFPSLRGKVATRRYGRRPAPKSTTMKKRPNRTIGPDDESCSSSSESSISAFIKEIDMQLFDDEDEVESLLQL